MNLLVRVVRKGCNLRDDKNKFKNASASVGASHIVHVSWCTNSEIRPRKINQGHAVRLCAVCSRQIYPWVYLMRNDAFFGFNIPAYSEYLSPSPSRLLKVRLKILESSIFLTSGGCPCSGSKIKGFDCFSAASSSPTTNMVPVLCPSRPSRASSTASWIVCSRTQGSQSGVSFLKMVSNISHQLFQPFDNKIIPVHDGNIVLQLSDVLASPQDIGRHTGIIGCKAH
jgi:hypothetical protein